MKLVALLLAVGLFEMMGVTLVAMPADAAAQSPFAAGSRPPSAANPRIDMPAAVLIASRTQSYPENLQTEEPRKNLKKRARNRCARITTTCWNAA